MTLIKEVSPGTPAEEAGLEAGDRILFIEGQEVNDYIDYLFLTSEAEVVMQVKKGSTGKEREIFLQKNAGDYTGVLLDGIIYDKLKMCNNRCLFCFIDQGAPGFRSSLQKKDDDYRFSFLQGSFLTLTNLAYRDRMRIKDMGLSPLYVSLHTTNGYLRAKMMGNPRAGRIMSDMEELLTAGIEFHLQIVICPGLNDGKELQRTLKDLYELGDGILSIGIVPVGLTRYRENLYPLREVNKENALEILKTITEWQSIFYEQRGGRVVFAADEFYWLTEKKLPDHEEYEGYPQLENGVGVTRDFLMTVEDRLEEIKKYRVVEKSWGVVTGRMGQWVWEKISPKLEGKNIRKPQIFVVENKTYGDLVTVSGLLCGVDIISTLQNEELPGIIFLPATMFNDEGKTLDGYTAKEIGDSLPCEVAAKNDIAEIMARLEGR